MTDTASLLNGCPGDRFCMSGHITKAISLNHFNVHKYISPTSYQNARRYKSVFHRGR